MRIRDRMIILPLSIVIHYCLTKTSYLTFIGFHSVQLQCCLMAVTISVRAPSWKDDVRACALTLFVPYKLRKLRLTNGAVLSVSTLNTTNQDSLSLSLVTFYIATIVYVVLRSNLTSKTCDMTQTYDWLDILCI